MADRNKSENLKDFDLLFHPGSWTLRSEVTDRKPALKVHFVQIQMIL